MRILVPVEVLEPVPTKKWPGRQAQLRPRAATPHPVQPRAAAPQATPAPPRRVAATGLAPVQPKPAGAARKPSETQTVSSQPTAPAHPTAAVTKATTAGKALFTDVSSGTGYDVATGERLAAAELALGMPIGTKWTASALLPINVDVRNSPSQGQKPLPSLKTASEALTAIAIGGETLAVAFPPAAEVAVPIAEGAQTLNTLLEGYEVSRQPTTGGVVLFVTDAALLEAGHAAPRINPLSTPQGKKITRVVVLASHLSLVTGTTIKPASPRFQRHRPSWQAGP